MLTGVITYELWFIIAVKKGWDCTLKTSFFEVNHCKSIGLMPMTLLPNDELIIN
jgi:hypothetical protein